MRKKLLLLVVAGTMVVASLTACGSDDSNDTDTAAETTEDTEASEDASDAEPTEKEDVYLTVWGAEEDQEMLAEMIDSFEEEYADTANWNIELGVESESTAKDTVLNDVEAAADVFAFADDQLNDLVNAGALQPITLNTDDIIAANGGSDAGVIQAASSDGQLYAYPMTSDNGFFLFYNSEYYTEDDVQSLDTMMQIAADNGKKVAMTVSDGWYLYSFFKGAGLDVYMEDDGATNYCNWNATDGTYSGADVAEAVLEITANDGFSSLADEEIVTGINNGEVIAAVSGTWNAGTASDAWGENYAASKLPTFTCAGDQVQMASFAGYKLVGVNAYSEYAGYAMILGEYLTNYDNQVKRFQERGLGPSNVEAAASDEVQSDVAMAAFSAQMPYAYTQSVTDNYWDPAATLGEILAKGNKDNQDLQTMLDTAVEGITTPVATE